MLFGVHVGIYLYIYIYFFFVSLLRFDFYPGNVGAQCLQRFFDEAEFSSTNKRSVLLLRSEPARGSNAEDETTWQTRLYEGNSLLLLDFAQGDF